MLGLDASKVKIPLNRMKMLSADTNLTDTRELIVKSGHSRIPVYQENEAKKILGDIIRQGSTQTRG